jgi:transcriptional regulator with XRE-family HTH domain
VIGKGAVLITNNILKIRTEKGLTQAQLAERLNVQQSMISMIENEERNPSVDVLLKLASALGVTVDELIGKAG